MKFYTSEAFLESIINALYAWNKIELPYIPFGDYAKGLLYFQVGKKKMNEAGFYKDEGDCRVKVHFDEYVPLLNLTTDGMVLDGILYFENQCQKRGEQNFSEVFTLASRDIHFTGKLDITTGFFIRVKDLGFELNIDRVVSS